MKYVVFSLVLGGLAGPALADSESRSPVSFHGTWQIAFLAGEGVIVNTPVVSCDNPAVIRGLDEDSIHVRAPGGDLGYWQINSFDGRNPWWPEDADGNELESETLVARWSTDESFILASRIPGTGSFNYDTAMEWTRCPSE